jgi:hypothetical protein
MTRRSPLPKLPRKNSIRWKHVSASQFKTFSLCARKWHIERFSGLPRPEPSAAMLLGTAVHAHIESRLLTGRTEEEDAKLARIVAPGLPAIRALSALAPLVEEEILLPWEDDRLPPLKGFIDAAAFPLKANDPAIPRPIVVDHKTVGNWKYAKTDEELETDLQMIPYARWALGQNPDAGEVEVAHFQYGTKGAPTFRKVSAVLSREHVEKEWENLEALLLQMRAEAEKESAREVAPNWNACGAFGGCPYADTCAALKSNHPKPGALEGFGKGAPTMSTATLDALLKARAAQPAPEPMPQPENPTGDAFADVVAICEERELAQILPPEVRDDRENPPAEVEAAPEPLPLPKVAKLATPATASAFGIFPGLPASAASLTVGDFQRATDEVTVALTSLGDMPEADTRKIVAEALGKLRLRGDAYLDAVVLLSGGLLKLQGKGLALASGPAQRAAEEWDKIREETIEAKPAPKPAPVKVKAKPAPAPEPPEEEEEEAEDTLAVFVDVVPVKGAEGVLLEDLLAPLIEEVAEAHGGEDPLALDYRKGPRAVAALLRLSIPSGVVLVSSSSDYWKECSGVLLAAADVVLRGVR